MPAKQTKSRRAERCCYVEGGVRCRRSGSGEPSFCNPHRIVMRDASRPPPAFGEGVKNLVDRFVNGKKVSRKIWEGALGDVAAWAAQAAQEQAGQQQPQPGMGGGAAPRNSPFSPHWWQQHVPPRRPPPPPDPNIEARRRARITLGFGPGEPITLEMIQKQRRTLARKHHPDRGGSVGKMQAVNAAADILEAEIAAT